MTSQERRRRLFYAEALAGLYDGTIELVVPQYKLMHGMIVSLVRAHLAKNGGPKAVLDLGSGSGAESLRILEEFPLSHVVAVDICAPMHLELKRNFISRRGKAADFSKSVTTITADMVGPEAIPDKLLSNLPATHSHGGFDAIVSALAFHHLTHNEKREAYRRAFECLRPGGVFVNGDLFSYRSHELTLQAQEYDLAWIDRQFRSPPAELRDAQAIPEGRRDELRELWMEHYRSDNIVEPLESTEHTEGQIDMLRSIGFADVGCPFRYQQLAILWARK